MYLLWAFLILPNYADINVYGIGIGRFSRIHILGVATADKLVFTFEIWAGIWQVKIVVIIVYDTEKITDSILVTIDLK